MLTIPWDFMDKTMQTGKMVTKFIAIPVSFLPLEKSCHCSHMYQITYQVSNSFSALDAAAEITLQLSEEADDSFLTLPFILLPLHNSSIP